MFYPEKNSLSDLLLVILTIALWTLANVFIATTVAGVCFMQLVVIVGWSKQVSLIAALLVAVVVTAYIWLQPKIRSFISRS